MELVLLTVKGQGHVHKNARSYQSLTSDSSLVSCPKVFPNRNFSSGQCPL